MEMVARGDHDAFAALFHRHERGARTFVFRTVRDQDLAEDIVQEVFTKIWIEAPRWQTRGSFRSFLTTMLSRRCLDHFRKSETKAKKSELQEDLPARGENAMELAARKEELHFMTAAIEGLPDRQRMALLMVHSEDLSVREAAKAMNVGEKALESLLSRAREKLRGLFRERKET